MKIGFDAKRAFLNTTGLGNYSRTLMNSLAKNYADNQYVLYYPQKNIGFQQTSFSLTENMKVQTPKNALQALAGGSFWRSWSLGKQMKKDELDIYHGLSNELPFSVSQNTKKPKTVVTIHDLIFMKYPSSYPVFDRFMYRKKWQHSCKVADKIIAISEETKSDIVNFLKIDESKISVIHQSCNAAFYAYDDAVFLQHGFFMTKEYDIPYDIPSDYILYVGSITKRKNLLTLVKAINVLKNEYEEAHLVVVSRNNEQEYEAKVKQYIAENGLQKYVTFLDNVSQKHLPSIYRCAKVYINPSLFEGFGIPVIEALFSRIPVVCSDNVCFREAAGKGAVYVDAENVEEMAEAIHKCLTEGALRMDLIMYGWEHAQQFRQDKTAEKMFEIYKHLV
ncbi:MAG: glycosyltransferase family 4 protein [Chitinophagales bacterium]